MSTISRSAIVPHSAADMYALVADIESYPEFLPWCGGTRIMTSTADEIVASIEIAYKGIRKAFTTRNRLQPGKMMEMQLVEGPFRRLQGFWRFAALDEGSSKVALDLEFEFSNALVRMAIGSVFSDIAGTLVDSFVERARRKYGDSTGS
jgi:ribosome-associated toxin RatA of RatAB toxin-antitoxin module